MCIQSLKRSSNNHTWIYILHCCAGWESREWGRYTLIISISILCLSFYKHKHTSTNAHNKCMYKLLHILCMLKILIKAVSNDSHLAARKMSNYACWKTPGNNCERAAHETTTSQPQGSWWELKSERRNWIWLLMGAPSPSMLRYTVYKPCF